METVAEIAPEGLAPLPSHVPAGLQDAWRVLQAPGVPDLVWTRRNGGHWIATRGTLIREGFEDYKHFSSACPFIPRETGEAYDFIPTSMDPPEQRPFRALASAALGMPVVDGMEPKIRE